MDASKLFINDAGRLRSGLRVALFVLVYFVLLFLISTIVRVVYAGGIYFLPNLKAGFYVEDLAYRLIILTTSLGAGYFCARLIEGLPWRSLGLSFHTRWFKHLLLGTGIGIASLALATAIATAGGGLRFAFSSLELLPLVARTLVFSGIVFVVAALAEEALFRGYPLQTLTRAQLAVLGVLLTSVPFAAIHLQNPNVAKGFTFVNTALAGVWLAVAYLRTRSLWFPLGVHWSWNWALGSLFGLPVSGITRLAPNPLLQATDLGPAWLTGGSYGIEGGVACTITLVISTIFIWRTRLVSPQEDLKLLTSQENPSQSAFVVPIVPQTSDEVTE